MATKQDAKNKQSSAAKGEDAKKNSKASHEAEPKTKSSETHSAAEIDEDQAEELDELLEAFGDGDLTAIDLDEATEIIEEWQEILSKSKDAEQKAIANSLKQLKKSLSSGKAKAEDLAELFSQLGEQIDEYGNNAERGYKTKMHDLGRAFKRVSRSLHAEEE